MVAEYPENETFMFSWYKDRWITFMLSAYNYVYIIWNDTTIVEYHEYVTSMLF